MKVQFDLKWWENYVKGNRKFLDDFDRNIDNTIEALEKEPPKDPRQGLQQLNKLAMERNTITMQMNAVYNCIADTFGEYEEGTDDNDRKGWMIPENEEEKKQLAKMNKLVDDFREHILKSVKVIDQKMLNYFNELNAKQQAAMEALQNKPNILTPQRPPVQTATSIPKDAQIYRTQTMQDMAKGVKGGH